MCPGCKHQLSIVDLIPVISWILLKGRCRYCKKTISVQYPLVELLTAILFSLSYILWPSSIHGVVIFEFIIWCMLLTGFMALAVYDLRWYILPNRIVYPLFILAILISFAPIVSHAGIKSTIVDALIGMAIGGGLFYVLFVASNGSWIGGGDVRLGGLLGLIVGGPFAAMLMLMTASGVGTLIAVPLVMAGKAKRNTRIPFGPLLIVGAIVAELFAASIKHWSLHLFS